jgi:hypothetical protein
MDCHLNCHGELNALIMSMPFVAIGWLRLRVWLRSLRAR